MGKKKGGCGGGEKYAAAEEAVAVPAAREFVLKVAMHCRCHGCTDKVRAAVRDLTQAPGVEAADCSAAESSGELRLLATADPEKLRRRLRRATGKKVDLLLPKERAAAAKKREDDHADAAALQALLAELQLQAPAPAARQQYGGQGVAPWANHQHQQQQQMLLGGCYGNNAGGYGAAYPWPSSSSYYPAAPASVWGAYGYAPQAPAPTHGGNVGYYGAGAPAWLGHGY